jgi:hypothetical protein
MLELDLPVTTLEGQGALVDEQMIMRRRILLAALGLFLSKRALSLQERNAPARP